MAGSSAAVAAGVASVIADLKEGGGRGAGTGIGSALSVASLIPDPQPPFVATAAGIAALSSRGYSPQRERDLRQGPERSTGKPEVTAPNSMERAYDFATGGDSVDADYRGRTRVIVQRIVNVNVSAMDAHSVIDRCADIAEAVSKQMDAGHPVGVSVQKVIFGN